MADFSNWNPDPKDTDRNSLRKINGLLATAAGRYGADIFSSGTHVGKWGVIHALADSTITVIRGGVSQAGIALKARDRIYGEIESVTVTSGSVEAYRTK